MAGSCRCLMLFGSCIFRTYERAERFAGKYNAKVYKSTEELIADEDVDIVYVATPHTVHLERITLMVIEIGKPVLCEKPMAPNAQIVATGKWCRLPEERVYLMEAMWTRFLFLPCKTFVSGWMKAE